TSRWPLTARSCVVSSSTAILPPPARASCARPPPSPSTGCGRSAIATPRCCVCARAAPRSRSRCGACRRRDSHRGCSPGRPAAASARSASRMATRRSASSASRSCARGSARSRSSAAGAPTSPRAGRRERARSRDRRRRRAAGGTGRADHRARVASGRGAAPRRAPGRGAAPRRVRAAGADRAGAALRSMIDATTSARSIAASVRAGKTRARDVVAGALERIARRNAALNAFTAVLGERALADADAIDRRLAAGDDPGPLAGVPFAAKNLFDVAGLATLAGSKINAGHPPATRDAAAVARLRAAGAVLVAWSFDHVGPFARHVADLASAFDAIAGPDPLDPACSTLPPPRCSGELERGIDGLRLAVAGGHFARLAADEALAAVTRVAAALGARREVSLPEAHRARAAAQVITACEGSAYHLENLRARAADFDPMIRDRLLAAALLPAAAYLRAQRFRAWYRARVAEVFREVDVLLAPTTPWTAPAIGAPWTTRIDGTEVPTRGHLGV